MKRTWRYLSLLLALFSCFAGGLIFSEWVRIGVIADPKVIAGYYFGGEAMMAHGGWRYASAATYATAALIEGTSLIALGIITFIAALKSKGKITAIGCSIIIIWFLLIQLSMYGFIDLL